MKSTLKRAGYVLAACALSLGAYLATLQLSGNFHEVLPNELYRSNQPSAADIAAYAQAHGIRTIINLRGESSHAWYRQEVAVASELGLNHVDFRMSASRELDASRIEELADLMRRSPKPILIHCLSGSDRTGLASVIYLNRIAGVGAEQAEGQLSIFYGHIGIPYLSSTYAMDESWEKFEAILKLAAAELPSRG
jgi:protein tyrosine/serine phosphatase